MTLRDLAARHDVRSLWGGHASLKILVANAFLEKKLPVMASRYLCREITTCERLIDEAWMTEEQRKKLRAEAAVYVEALKVLDQVAA
ncbi:MAG TPA: hypothetical protein VGQ38_15575 [Gaiellaceae bacterium]|nr:hypothetical protein [Gaiellaceae bacterium]